MKSVSDLATLSDEELAAEYAWPEGSSLRLNMLIGPAGNTTGADGTSNSLTTSSDRRLLRLIREQADAIVLGASSVRSEGWFLPPHGTLIVLSESGSLPWESCPDPGRVVVCHDIPQLLSWFRDHPGRHLCEGGFSTARLLDQTVGFAQIALTSHLESAEALALITEHPEQFTLAFAANAESQQPPTSEAFFLWRRAAALKE